MQDKFLVGWETIRECARGAGLDTFPNDLTRMLYLASLRDCNSGCYRHAHLSPRMGTEMADRGLHACHVEIFRRLLTTPPSEYVLQLEEYIRYTRTDRFALLGTWQTLQAYRATVPVRSTSLYCQIFFLNVELALLIVSATRSPADRDSQELN